MKKIQRVVLILFIPLFLIVLRAPAAHAVPPEPDVYEQSFSSDHELTGLFASFTESFFSGDWAVEQALFTMNYDVTPLLNAELSSFTVSLNGRKVYSGRLAPSAGETQRALITLPPESVQKGVNYLTVETYMRVSAIDPCADDNSKACWMNVYKNSGVALAYRPLAVIGSISALYGQFTSLDALYKKQSAFVIGDNAPESALSCLAAAMAGMADSAVRFYENMGLRVGSGEDVLFRDSFQIYLARIDRLDGVIAGALTPGQLVSAGEGIALVLLEQNGKYLLAGIGADDAAMKTLGRLLGNASYMAQFQSAFSQMASSEDVLTPPGTAEQYRPLTDNGVYVRGAFRQNADFYLRYPENRVLKADSLIRLVFRYAENLDFTRSLVTVYINDQPVGSKKLSLGSAQGDSMELFLPADLEVSGSFSLRVAFDLELPDLSCSVRQEETPWAYISADSILRLNSVYVQGLIFEHYPSPFVLDGRLNNVAVVLPKSPTSADYEAFRLITLTLGRFVTDNAGDITVFKGTEKDTMPSANVIAIGRYGMNQIAQDVNSELFFRFDGSGTTIVSNEKMRIEPAFGATLGSVQLLYAPLSGKQRALMVVSGASDDAMLKAMPYIGSVEGLWKVYGDGFVADSEKAHSFRFKADNASAAPAKIMAQSRQDVLGLSLAAGGVLLLMLFAVSMMMLKYRRK